MSRSKQMFSTLFKKIKIMSNIICRKISLDFVGTGPCLFSQQFVCEHLETAAAGGCPINVWFQLFTSPGAFYWVFMMGAVELQAEQFSLLCLQLQVKLCPAEMCKAFPGSLEPTCLKSSLNMTRFYRQMHPYTMREAEFNGCINSSTL